MATVTPIGSRTGNLLARGPGTTTGNTTIGGGEATSISRWRKKYAIGGHQSGDIMAMRIATGLSHPIEIASGEGVGIR
jgi:hypothetical protein